MSTSQTSAVRLVCLGLSALDLVWDVESLPAGGGKTRASDFRESGGGMAATAAVAAARLGAQVAFWGRAGDDAAGESMRRELAGYGVCVTHFRQFPGGRSSVSGVIVDGSGERLIVNFRGRDLPEDPSWLPLHEVAGCGAVLADPRWPAGAEALFRAARAAGVPTVLDADVAEAPVFDRLLPHTDFAIFSAPALAAYGGPDPAQALAAAMGRGCRIAGVTQGEEGVLWDDGSGMARLPAFPVHVVDTNGAGDVFHGALAVAVAQGQPVRQALRFAAAAAALKCTQRGGRAGAPDLARALSFMEKFKE